MMVGIRRLGAERDNDLESRLAVLAERLQLRNVFNPSPVGHRGVLHVAFRAIGPQGGRVRAYLARLDEAADVVFDLTECANRFGIPFIADPKLLALDGEVYVTFNSGFSAGHPNTIYLQRVTPELEAPQECLLDDRQVVEKNWAFFEASNELRALYSLQPLVTLALREGQLGSDGPLTFERRNAQRSEGPVALTIGSQMIIEADRGLLIAHSKIKLGRKRVYVGHLVAVDLAKSEPAVYVSSTVLIDSWRALFPQRHRLNPNLWSATYFSGIARTPGGLLVGYGVNDSRAALARVTEEMIR